MRATVRRLHSPDVKDLKSYHPPSGDDFNVFIQAMIGPQDGVGEESFGLTVERDASAANPKWVQSRLLINHFDYFVILQELDRLCAEAEGDNWRQLASHLGAQLLWEFEGYRT